MGKKEVAREILSLSNMMCRRIDCERIHHGLAGLTYLQGGIIHYLLENQGKDIFPKDIVRRFAVTRSTVAGALKKMEEHGYICFAPAAHDGRMKKIVVTEKGIAEQNAIERHKEALERLLVRGMTAQETDELFLLLGKIRQNLLEAAEQNNAQEKLVRRQTKKEEA